MVATDGHRLAHCERSGEKFDGVFTTIGNYTNSGKLTVGAGSAFTVAAGHSLTNFSGTTLPGGTYTVVGS